MHQHVLSAGKDGKLVVQDIRTGYFPRQHIASSVAVVSSQGHVAFHTGRVQRVCG